MSAATIKSNRCRCQVDAMYDSVQVHRLPSEHDVPGEFAPRALGKDFRRPDRGDTDHCMISKRRPVSDGFGGPRPSRVARQQVAAFSRASWMWSINLALVSIDIDMALPFASPSRASEIETTNAWRVCGG